MVPLGTWGRIQTEPPWLLSHEAELGMKDRWTFPLTIN